MYGSRKFKHPLNLLPDVMFRQTLTQPMILVVALLDEMKGRWMNGPPFLRNDPKQWPTETNEKSPEIPEMKASKPLLVLQPSKPSTIIDPTRYSNWPKLCRVTAYCIRFINNAKSRDLSGPLSPDETAAAECY